MQAFIDLSSKVNAIYLDFTEKLSFLVKHIVASIQKINNSKLEIFDMVITSFSI